MASGRKHASFRHRSQSDNGVIMSSCHCHSEAAVVRLHSRLEASLRLPSCAAAAPQLGCKGGPAFALEGAAVDMDISVPRVLCWSACGRSVVRCIWEHYLIEASWPFQRVLLMEEVVEGLGRVGGLQGARSE